MAGIGIWQVAGLVAGSSVLSALVTQGLTFASRWRERRRSCDLSRLYLALALETYASACAETIAELEDINEETAASSNGVPPFPDFPDNVDWTALGLDAANRLFSFRTEIEMRRTQIRELVKLGLSDGINESCEHAGKLGLKALSLSDWLRALARSPRPPNDIDWSIADYLAERRNAYVANRKKLEAHAERRRAAAESVLPPF